MHLFCNQSNLQQCLKSIFLEVVLRCFKGNYSKTNNFLTHSIPSNRKPNFETFGQVSSKSNVAFGRYRLKSPFFSQKGCFWVQQVRLAMVPRDSQQQTQLYEQLT